MKVHVLIPYAPDKNFGVWLNEAVELIPDNDFICVIDYDVMFLTHDAISILHKYAEKYPDALFTCWTNRVGCKQQCHDGFPSGNDSIRKWMKLAEEYRMKGITVTEFKDVISGFLLMFSKKTWKEAGGFTEDKKILGIDNNFAGRVLKAGRKIYRMDSVLVWHSYRLLTGKLDKSHLL